MLGDHRSGENGDVDVGVGEGGGASAGGGEQIVEQPAHPGGGPGDDCRGLPPVVGRGVLVGQHRLDVGLDDGDRVAELVRHVGHQPPLGGERRVEAAEHPVDGVGQHAELVAGPVAPIRRDRSVAVISRVASVIADTGRSARPATHQPISRLSPNMITSATTE